MYRYLTMLIPHTNIYSVYIDMCPCMCIYMHVSIYVSMYNNTYITFVIICIITSTHS